MSTYNDKRKRCAKIIELEFKEVTKLPPTFSLDYGMIFTKNLSQSSETCLTPSTK